ncbi:hypothetical protein BH09BAC3_BH09BAC3_24860 [soil metagenome]
MLRAAPRWIIILLIFSLTFLLLSFVLFPPVAKWYIERNSVGWTGRKITLDGIHLNPFTASISIDKFDMREYQSDESFIGFNELYINVGFWRALSGGLDIEEIRLSDPSVVLIQKYDKFNFDDLLRRFASDSTPVPAEVRETEPFEFYIRNIQLINGTITYKNVDLSSEIKVLKIETKCGLLVWNDPHEHFDFSLALASGGQAKGTFDIDLSTLKYRSAYQVDSLNLKVFYPYVRDYIKVGTFEGMMSADQRIYGDGENTSDFAMTGVMSIHDFIFKDYKNEDLVALKEMAVSVDTLNVVGELYDLRYITLNKPFLKFELFPEGTNFDKLMNETSSESATNVDSLSSALAYGNIFALMATYIQDLTQNYAISNYKVDSLVLRNGTFVFNDYTLQSRFNYVLEDLTIKADRVSSENEFIKFTAASTLNKSGRMDGRILVEPHAFKDMDIVYSINDLKVVDFNPYSSHYVATPFLNGTIYYTSSTKIVKRQLDSNHKIEIRGIKAGKKVRNKTAYRLPVRLAVALLRDKNGDIKIELPIEGNLDDPKYKIRKVIWQVFTNLLKKAVAAPGKLLAGKSSVDEKELIGLTWQPLQTGLTEAQKKSLSAMYKALQSTPEMNVELVNLTNEEREMDELALREGKKKFLFFRKKIASEEDVHATEEPLLQTLEPKDTALHSYLDQQLKISDQQVSVFDKSKMLVGKDKLKSLYNGMLKSREASVAAYLVSIGMPEEKFKITEPKEKVNIAYESDSRFSYAFVLNDEPGGDQ